MWLFWVLCCRSDRLITLIDSQVTDTCIIHHITRNYRYISYQFDVKIHGKHYVDVDVNCVCEIYNLRPHKISSKVKGWKLIIYILKVSKIVIFQIKKSWIDLLRLKNLFCQFYLTVFNQNSFELVLKFLYIFKYTYLYSLTLIER